MKEPLHSTFRRAFGVLWLLAAWFALSNHCALAAVGGGMTQPAQVHSCCAQKGSTGQEHSHEGRADLCCKTLRALPQDAPAKLIKAQDAVLLFELAWAEAIDASVLVSGTTGWTGAAEPAESRSFAELVLQASLRSHAPPVEA